MGERADAEERRKAADGEVANGRREDDVEEEAEAEVELGKERRGSLIGGAAGCIDRESGTSEGSGRVLNAGGRGMGEEGGGGVGCGGEGVASVLAAAAAAAVRAAAATGDPTSCAAARGRSSSPTHCNGGSSSASDGVGVRRYTAHSAAAAEAVVRLSDDPLGSASPALAPSLPQPSPALTANLPESWELGG